jgi:hypothetical protein
MRLLAAAAVVAAVATYLVPLLAAVGVGGCQTRAHHAAGLQSSSSDSSCSSNGWGPAAHRHTMPQGLL